MYKSSARGKAPVRLIAVHTAEGAQTADSLAAYFRRDDIEASSHVAIDDNKTVEMVPYDRASWTLRSGNPVSDNAELAAFAKWSRDVWLTRDDLLTRTARWIADRCRTRGIPCVKLTAAQVRAGQSGVIGHIDWTDGMRDGTHWDPGPGFPWDVVMARAQAFLGGQPPAPVKPELVEDDMLSILAKAKDQPWVYLIQGNTRTWVPDQYVLSDLLWLDSQPGGRFLQSRSVQAVSQGFLEMFSEVSPIAEKRQSQELLDAIAGMVADANPAVRS